MKRATFTVVALSVALGTAAFAANSLTVVTPGLNGTGKSLRVNLDGSSSNVYVEDQSPTDENHYLFRFWVDPTLLATLTPNTSIRIGAVNSSTYGQRIVVFLRYDQPGLPQDAQFQVNTWGLQDAGEPANYTFLKGVNIGPVSGSVSNQVEIEWTRSTGSSVNDAVFRIQRITPGNVGINQVVTPLTMYNFTVDDVRFGVLAGSGTNMLSPGSYRFDEFESYR